MVISARTLYLPLGPVTLKGQLSLPQQATGLIVLALGTGGGHRSARRRHLAQHLQQAEFGTLCCDLLTPAEERTRDQPGQLALLTARLASLVRWTQQQPELLGHRLGLLGEDTSAAAALRAAAALGEPIGAVVSFGGRPDLALPVLPQVQAPTLLLVGELDEPGLAHNTRARQAFCAPNDLQAIPGAGRLFQEPGALGHVVEAATAWFHRTLPLPRPQRLSAPSR